MKSLLKYLFLSLVAIIGITSCQDNENWKIVTEAQPGTYVVGSATIFSGEASASALPMMNLDGEIKTTPEILGKYVWLKSDGEFFISFNSEVGGIPARHGKGEILAGDETGITRYALTDGAAGFTVAADGMYLVVVNTALKQMTLLPAMWGVIGDATPGGWGAETPFEAPTFDPVANTVSWEQSVNLTNAAYKFRFSGNWGYEIPLDESTNVKFFTDITGAKTGGDNVLTEGFSTLQIGGDDLVSPIGGQHSIYLQYDIRSGSYSARYVLTGEAVIPPEYPEKLFIVGDAYKGWEPTTDAEELVPVNGNPAQFWKVAYLKAGGFKFAIQKAWGGDFGITETNTDAIGEYTKGTNNITVATEGHYLVFVDLDAEVVSVTEAEVYVLGDAIGTFEYVAANKFTASGTSLVSPAVTADDFLRMAIKHPLLTDWWRAEFNVYEGAIEFRGNGGDQAAVPVTIGQTVTLDFNAGTGVIN